MNGLYYLRWPLIIFLIGFLIRFTGILFKIRHWPSADEMITIGSIICGIGIVFGIIKIAVVKKPEQ
ncbi:MAG: gliding motility protein GldL [Bacteroidetes bacterium]|nr:MAG: gliding motility protein GldL [Bacteroidota bacterium]